MVYHIVSVDSVYAYELLDFAVKYRHKMTCEFKFVSTFCVGDKYRDVGICANTFLRLFVFFLLLKKGDRIVLHRYEHPYFYLLLFIMPWVRKKVTWQIWGSDFFYFYKNRNSLPFKHKIYEIMRKCSVKDFGYISGGQGDYDMVVRYYGYKRRCPNLKLRYPINWEAADFFRLPKKYGSFCVLVGNSGDYSNNHIEAIDALSRFRDDDLSVVMPLSYGGDDDYIKNVIDYGRSVFGDKFVPLTNLLNQSEYLEFISNTDVSVFFHDRQQGLGTVLLLLMMGKKIYIKREVTSNVFLNDLGIDYFNTEDIGDFVGLVSYSEKQAVQNLNRLEEVYRDDAVVDNWNRVHSVIMC